VASSMSSAPELLREQVAALLVQPLGATSTVLRLPGLRRFTTSGGVPIRVPKLTDYAALSDTNLTASATFGWVGESGLIPESDVDVGEVPLLPNTLKSVKVLHRLSAELARHAVVDVVAAIRDALVRRVAMKVDWTFLRGTGASDRPVGLLNIPGRLTDSFNWEPDEIFGAVGTLLGVDAELRAWIMHPDRLVESKTFKSTAGEYVLSAFDVADGFAYRLVGLPVYVTTLMPTNRVLLLDRAQLAVGQDLDASVVIDRSRYLEYDEVAVRVVTRLDLAALNPSAVLDLTVS
jgi:HK97 family phage major capsid protein